MLDTPISNAMLTTVLSVLLLLFLRVALFGHLLSATEVRLNLQGQALERGLRRCKVWSVAAGVSYLLAAGLVGMRCGALAALSLAWVIHLSVTALVWRDEHREGWCSAKNRPAAKAEDLGGKLLGNPAEAVRALWALAVLTACLLWLQPSNTLPSQWLFQLFGKG